MYNNESAKMLSYEQGLRCAQNNLDNNEAELYRLSRKLNYWDFYRGYNLEKHLISKQYKDLTQTLLNLLSLDKDTISYCRDGICYEFALRLYRELRLRKQSVKILLFCEHINPMDNLYQDKLTYIKKVAWQHVYLYSDGLLWDSKGIVNIRRDRHYYNGDLLIGIKPRELLNICNLDKSLYKIALKEKLRIKFSLLGDQYVT